MNSLISCYTVSISVLASLSGKFSILQLIFTLIVYISTYTIYYNFTIKYNIYELTTGKFYHNLLYGSYFTIGAIGLINSAIAKLHLTSTSNVNSVTSTSSNYSGQKKCNYTVKIMNQLIILGSVVLLYTLYPFVLSANVFGDKKHRIVINTLLALTSSTVTIFALTSIIDPKNRFNVVSVVLIMRLILLIHLYFTFTPLFLFIYFFPPSLILILILILIRPFEAVIEIGSKRNNNKKDDLFICSFIRFTRYLLLFCLLLLILLLLTFRSCTLIGH